MGAYINPRGQTKEEWLEEHGLLIAEGKNSAPTDHQLVAPPDYTEAVLVCLVDNRPKLSFTAAGVAFNWKELERFAYPCNRIKKWYWCEKADLLPISDLISEDDWVIPYVLPDDLTSTS